MTKIKQIQFEAVKVKSAEDGEERKIVFVASSSELDRHGEHVDVKSLRLPLKAGGTIQASELGADGTEGIDIPLMLNHSFDVTDVIGSVRKAWIENGELVFEAGISKREIAQEILTLIEEEHLSNAFSITMHDFDYNEESATIIGAEIIEVSVVFRGANKEARLLALKSLLESKDAEAEAEAEESEEKTEESDEEPTEPKAEDSEQKSENSEEARAEAEDKDESATTEAEETEVENTNEETEESEMTKIAQDEVVEKATQPIVAESSNYLSSKEALADFAQLVCKSHRSSNEQIMKAWTASLSSKGITGDAILPARIEQIFFKTWTDKGEILRTFRQLGLRSCAVYAMKASANGEAKAHTKGAQKVDQDIEAVRRDLKGLGIYKKLPIDLQDLFDDETGELLAFRVEELAERVAHAIVVGAIVGGYKNDNRGLFSMKEDLDNAQSEDFAGAVATVVTAPEGATDTEIAKAIRTLGAVKGESKVLAVPANWLTNARIDLIGMNYPVADIAEFVGADEIVELDEIATTGYDMIAYKNQSYTLVGERNAATRTDFDLQTNTDVMLVERYVGGSATGYKTVAGYKSGE